MTRWMMRMRFNSMASECYLVDVITDYTENVDGILFKNFFIDQLTFDFNFC